MKKALTFLAALILSTPLLSQDLSEINIITGIADKPAATFSDAVNLFVIVSGEKARGDVMKTSGIQNITRGMNYRAEDPLRRGALALMIARHLDLRGTLLYSIFRTERYAYKVCVKNHVMESDGSEWDRLSGGELVEIMRKVSAKKGGDK
jgi:hypothetical protein